MKIGIAQLNLTVGDITGNSKKIILYVERAKRDGCDILVTPELSICGYPPEDLLLRDDFCNACEREITKLAQSVHGLTLVVGHPHKKNGKLFNAASVLSDGKILDTYFKQNLPNYTVFDERRYFTSGDSNTIFEVAGKKIGINICEDVWTSDFYTELNYLSQTSRQASPVSQAKKNEANVLIVLNASPFHLDKHIRRVEVVRRQAMENQIPIIFCNMVGGQDELIFDGKSFAVDSTGKLTNQMMAFEEDIDYVNFEDNELVSGVIVSERGQAADIYEALKIGVRDYFRKGGFSDAIIGLSGGIDSALTLCVAADALGEDAVHAVMMPSQYTSDMSLEDSRKIKNSLGVKYSEISIQTIYENYIERLNPVFSGLPSDTTEENLQSRIRGTLLMAMSNKFGSLVLSTGNKSEMSTGYATLYGDMAGGFAVLKDISKQWVYRLAKYRNAHGLIIPERVISRPPSAELREDQIDEDSLPPYEILDAILQLYVEQNKSLLEIVNRGYPRDTVEQIVKLVHNNEYKRRQAPIGIRITPRAYGKDWRYPIINRFRVEG
mgnify:CR=1 FL=1